MFEGLELEPQQSDDRAGAPQARRRTVFPRRHYFLLAFGAGLFIGLVLLAHRWWS